MRLKDIEPYRSIIFDILSRDDYDVSVANMYLFLHGNLTNAEASHLYKIMSPKYDTDDGYMGWKCIVMALYMPTFHASMTTSAKQYYELIGDLECFERLMAIK